MKANRIRPGTTLTLLLTTMQMPGLLGAVRQTSQLTAEERAGLVFMREEEKLARDVYRVLGAKWGGRPFSNITLSEQQHMDAVKGLLDRYGIADPAKDKEGEFTNPDMTALYAQLVKSGFVSRVEALKVGALIEDLDLYDLERWTAKSKNTNVQQVYANLAKGSRNHLRSFVRTAQQAGGTYSPKYLTKSQFDKIISASMERGRGGID